MKFPVGDAIMPSGKGDRFHPLPVPLFFTRRPPGP